VDTEAVLRLLQDVAEEVVNPRFRSLSSGEIDEKGPGDLVTDADREAEELITAALRAAYPDAMILGEETYAERRELMGEFWRADHAFTVDPVDGTKNFVHGSPDHAVMVGERRGGVVTRGWIWHPQHQRMFVAERGAGAYADGVRLTTTPPAGDPATWRGRAARRRWVGRAPEGLAPVELSWVSCGVDYPRLVESAADYLLYRHTKPWDHVPGSLLTTEAGGVVGWTDGTAYDGSPSPRAGLVVAPDRATYDVVRAALSVGDWSE
jgi:fructose-1,6-bisphosphatase/inositol monophosphatase family enzyme